MKVIECVPNFSEGRDQEIINTIVSAVKEIEEVKVLDLHSDPDHNRSVITMISHEPKCLKEACMRLTKKAVDLIDIEKHQGVHPYIGVVDVIPFIPVSHTNPSECVGIAHELGQEIYSNFGIPVYFYGLATMEDSRRNLPDVRRGGYIKLKDNIKNSERKPDIGDAVIHPTAGAVAVGVRKFLIAYNVNLRTKDLNIAKAIARSIREQHGGLAGVRTIGVPISSQGHCQISINITDHQQSSLRDVFNAVSDEAEKHKVAISNSEIVGLIPQSAYFNNIADVLKLKKWDNMMVLENHL
ncbi:MAG: glutamate formimidoyltransferase [bacterium]